MILTPQVILKGYPMLYANIDCDETKRLYLKAGTEFVWRGQHYKVSVDCEILRDRDVHSDWHLLTLEEAYQYELESARIDLQYYENYHTSNPFEIDTRNTRIKKLKNTLDQTFEVWKENLCNK